MWTWQLHQSFLRSCLLPVGIYLLKVNSINTRTRCEICSNITTMTSEPRHWRRPGVSIVNLEYISHLVLVFLLLTLNMYLPGGWAQFHTIFTFNFNFIMKNIPAIVSGIYACKSSSSFQRVLNVIITNVISPNIIPARKHTRTISIIFVCHRPSTKKKNISHCTNIKFSITDFFSICDQIRRKLRIWSYLRKKSVM